MKFVCQRKFNIQEKNKSALEITGGQRSYTAEFSYLTKHYYKWAIWPFILFTNENIKTF